MTASSQVCKGAGRRGAGAGAGSNPRLLRAASPLTASPSRRHHLRQQPYALHHPNDNDDVNDSDNDCASSSGGQTASRLAPPPPVTLDTRETCDEPALTTGDGLPSPATDTEDPGGSDSETSPPASPSRAERRPLKVEFSILEEGGVGSRRKKMDMESAGGLQSQVRRDLDSITKSGSSAARFRQARLSLLGKPLSYKAHRRDVRYRRMQARIYNFLERPKLWRAWIYHFWVFFLVLSCLTLGVLSSIADFEGLLSDYAVYMEIVMLVWVTLEFILRLWSAGCRSRYQGLPGRLKFLQRPLCIIDIVLIMAGVTTLVVGSTQEHFAGSVISGLRFFQILRMMRMDRRGGTWKLLGSVVWAHSQELVTTLYIGMLGLIFSSYFVYLAEKDAPRPLREGDKVGTPPKFSNFADSIWWGVVTLCTVGYGDVVPTTWGGKVIASFSAVLGISFFALPAGILGSGFALKVQQQQRQKHMNRRRVPAAELIQCLWRCYAADEHSVSVATWKPHLVPCPSPTADRPWKNNTSFVSRFSTRRRDRSSTNNNSKVDHSAQSPMSVRHSNRRSAISNSEEEVPNVLDSLVNKTWSHLSLATGFVEARQIELLPVKKENSAGSICKDSEEEPELSPRITQLTEQDKCAIRALRKIRYFVARRKFREALRPYDVKDVIEQYSAGHIDMLARIKNLQGRLDQILGRQGSKGKDVYDSKISLASRVVKVERQVEDIESKVDLLIDMYKEDRKILLQHLQLQYGTPSPGPPPAQVKPRPILVDKQFTSEPATPTGVGQNPNRPMHRNLSDLSQRIKKRVTYRCLSLHDPPKKNPVAGLKVAGSPTAHGSSPLAAAGRCDGNVGGEGDRNDVDSGGQGLATPSQPQGHGLRPPSPRAGPTLAVPPDSLARGGAGSEDALIDFSSIPVCEGKPGDTCYSFDDPRPLNSSPLATPLLPPVFAHAPGPLSVVTPPLAYSVLSTLSEQRSIESDTSIPFLDVPPCDDLQGSRATDDGAGSCVAGGAVDGGDDESGAVSVRCMSSKSDPSAIPTLESLTDFHVDCDATRLTYS